MTCLELSNCGLLKKSGIILFADDIKLHRVINSDIDSAHLQHVIYIYADIDWSQKRQLNVNSLKCSVVGLHNCTHRYTKSTF